MFDWVKTNYQWLFSGIGSGLVCLVLGWLWGSKHGYSKAIKQTMEVGDGSTAIQIGRDYKK